MKKKNTLTWDRAMIARHLIWGLAARKAKASLSEGEEAAAAGAAAGAAGGGGAAAAFATSNTSTATPPVPFSRPVPSFFLSLSSFSSLLRSFRSAALDPSTGHLFTIYACSDSTTRPHATTAAISACTCAPSLTTPSVARWKSASALPEAAWPTFAPRPNIG